MRNPEDGSHADELQGNEFAAFASEVCVALHEHDRAFLFESSARSGRYPKIWDLPRMRKLRAVTGARLVPLHMCAWHLQSVDCLPGYLHKTPTWWLVSAELFPWVHLFISRHCPGVSTTHHWRARHTVPLCAAWGLVIMIRAGSEPWDWRHYLAGHCEAYQAAWGVRCPAVDFVMCLSRPTEVTPDSGPRKRRQLTMLKE